MGVNEAAVGSAVGDMAEQSGNQPAQEVAPRSTRESRRKERRARPRAPRAERAALGPIGDDTATAPSDGDPAASSTAPNTAEALVLDLAASRKRGQRTIARARKKQEVAAATLRGDEGNPALGALNRHLNLMMQQLTAAHRVIGRLAAERDALRQQLADLQGIPVEEIAVTTIGAASDQPARSSSQSEPTPPSLLSRLNYFNADDVAVARQRRQRFVLVILGVVLALWITARLGYWSLPGNLSRESLGDLPYVGDLVALFLAGWLMFRVIRVSSKGVRWVFPSEDGRRRRR